jgi:hypothetical protein
MDKEQLVRETLKNSAKNLLQCHFLDNKSHTIPSKTEIDVPN